MSRNDQLNVRQKLTNGAKDKCMPLGVEMEFGLIDNQKPLIEFQTEKRSEESEQLQLTRTQVIQRDFCRRGR